MTAETQVPEIVWALDSTDDWGGGLERTYRAENVEHAGCGGDVHLVHLHDPMGAILSVRVYCAQCAEDLTATPPPADGGNDGSNMPCGESGCYCRGEGEEHAECACGCDCPRYTNEAGDSVLAGTE